MTQFYSQSMTRLTSAGSTSDIDARNLVDHTVQIKTASMKAGAATVVLRLKGSMDGTNYFTVPITSTAMASLALSSNIATISANGTYCLTAKAKVKFLQLEWTSSTGAGATATIDVHYAGGR